MSYLSFYLVWLGAIVAIGIVAVCKGLEDIAAAIRARGEK
jgi:hypothetical protein